MCLRSDDIGADDSSLRQSGYRVLRDQPTVGAEGALVQWVHPKSTGGVLTELSQPTGEGHG